MDANRDRIKTKIAGRRVIMYRPKPEQFLAITMATDESIPELARYGAFTKMFVSLMPEPDDRGWFMEQLAVGNYSITDLVHTLKRIATAPAAHGKPVKSAPSEIIDIQPLDDAPEDDDDEWDSED